MNHTLKILTALLLAQLTTLTMAGWAGETNTATRLQEDFLQWKFRLFLHFNIATFNNQEWANSYEDPATFAPDILDCGQWADAAKAAGMKYAVLTAKHTGGCPSCRSSACRKLASCSEPRRPDLGDHHCNWT